MKMLTLASLCLSLVSLALSIGALIATRRTSDRSLKRRLDELCERSDATDRFTEQLMIRLRSEAAKNNMRWMRATQKAPEPEEPEASANGSAGASEAEKDRWTRETNMKIMRGEIKLPGRR